jgi:hypothetical protein
MDDLTRIFGELARTVPDGPPGEVDFVFDRGNLPSPPQTVATDRVFLQKSHHDYNGWYRAG